MQRNPISPNAAPNGWVWPDFNPNPASGRVNVALMNKFFPQPLAAPGPGRNGFVMPPYLVNSGKLS